MDLIASLTDDAEIAHAVGCIAQHSPTGRAQLEDTRRLGFRIIRSERPGGFEVPGFLDRHARLMEIAADRQGLPLMSLIAHESRHVGHLEAGVLEEVERLPPADALLGVYVMEADACAFQAYVATEMAENGYTTLWQWTRGRNAIGPALDTYYAAMHRGTPPAHNTALAMQALASEPEFLGFYEQGLIDDLTKEAADGAAPDKDGALPQVIDAIRTLGIGGVAYPDAPFRKAVSLLKGQVSWRRGRVLAQVLPASPAHTR